ncbi:MAG: PASTA domain-containing protein, partial [bacterium]
AETRVPDVTGMTVLEANKRLRSLGLQMTIEGSGLAVAQSPPPETSVKASATVHVKFVMPGENTDRNQIRRD